MGDTAIRVENLSKRYRLGERESYKALRDVIASASKAPFRRLRSSINRSSRENKSKDYIWALKDVSFEVQQGEVIGIIGRNGAGKSTLLKILSRITKPTNGSAEIHGRVGSLLEVGTGFHPELTGRENIYLNGAILGMQRAEIQRKFDEIVEFSEIEKFLDTPVKRYSSGMYVRLAFAVAAHLEPEILLVDEVLAVGDAAFQNKALGKMGNVVHEGRTVLFVSHNMAAVRTLCSRALLLQEGKVHFNGSVELTVSKYMNETVAGHYVAPISKAGLPHIARVWFSDTVGVVKEKFSRGEPIVINAELENPRNEALKLDIAFFDIGGYMLWNFTHEDYNIPPISSGLRTRVRIVFFVPTIKLQEIFVHVGLRVKGYHVTHYIDHITEGLRYLIVEPGQDSYRHGDSLLDCPVEFREISCE